MTNFSKKVAGIIMTLALLLMTTYTTIYAAPTSSNFGLMPWTFDPDNTCSLMVSQWDYSTGNPIPSIHLNKPCATANNASSGVSITGVQGITLTELNFDYRNDGHCGAGAPRFNVVATDGFHFLGGCANGTQTDLGNGWTHVVIDPTNSAQAFPVITPGATIQSIDIVFDEGTDTAGGTPGSIYIDNISVNDQVIGNPAQANCKKDGWKSLKSTNGTGFKNQGDCVSYFSTNGNNPANGQ